MIITITNITKNTPTPTPAWNMSPMASQLVSIVAKKSIRKANLNVLFFMIFCFSGYLY